MTAAAILDFFLTQIIVYGVAVFAAVLFLAAFGIPLPATALVLASGAFVQQGLMQPHWTFAVGLLAAVSGDTASFFVGRLGARWVDARFAVTPAWQSARDYLHRRGGIAIFLTRWMVTPLALPTNLIAGSSGYPFSRFATADIIGEAVWLLVYGSLGYALGSNWELINDVAGDAAGLLAGLALCGIGFALLRKRRAAPRSRVQ